MTSNDNDNNNNDNKQTTMNNNKRTTMASTTTLLHTCVVVVRVCRFCCYACPRLLSILPTEYQLLLLFVEVVSLCLQVFTYHCGLLSRLNAWSFTQCHDHIVSLALLCIVLSAVHRSAVIACLNPTTHNKQQQQQQ